MSELDDLALLQAAIGDVSKAKGMGQIAKEAGVAAKALQEPRQKRQPELPNHYEGIVHALGGRLTIQPAQAWLYDQHAAAVRTLEKGDR